MQDRFSLLEEIKSIKIGNEMTLTLSMGIGTGSAEYSKNYDVAKAAMDLALGRGGDQAVVKDGEKILYYGGKSQQMEKNTRVKVRVKAHALRQILDNNSNVLVMGHTLADIDAFILEGASSGFINISSGYSSLSMNLFTKGRTLLVTSPRTMCASLPSFLAITYIPRAEPNASISASVCPITSTLLLLSRICLNA